MKNLLFLGAIVAAGLPGCFVEADNGPGPPPVTHDTGALVLDWSIDGTKNPDQCDQSDATTLDITVTTDTGAAVGEFQQSCRAFATTVELPPGDYRAEAVLIDSAGRDRTTPVQVGDFTINGNDELSVPVDFPASSFY